MLLLFALILLASATEGIASYTVSTLKVGTWNTMLFPWMPYSDLVLKNLFDRHFDVLHLQEVWTEGMRNRIVQLAEQKGYRYHYISPNRVGETVGCDISDPGLIPQFIGCALTVGVNTTTLTQAYPVPLPSEGDLPCGLIGVGIALNGALNPGNPDPFTSAHKGQRCLACLVNTLQNLPSDFSSIEPAFITCAHAQAGPRFGLGGANGQIILSKHPISDVVTKEFDSWLLARANIYATIKNVKFAFGHWGFNVMADYHPGFAPFQLGTTGIDHAIDAVNSGADVILGDLNSGVNYQGEGYAHLLQNGYTDLVPQPTETWCPPSHLDWLPCVNAGEYSAAIDHILVKDSASFKGSRFTRLFATTPLMSDHLGVSAKISKKGLIPNLGPFE